MLWSTSEATIAVEGLLGSETGVTRERAQCTLRSIQFVTVRRSYD